MIVSTARALAASPHADTREPPAHLHAVPECAGTDPQFRADVLAGFAMRPQRTIPPRWFYDRRGSELFEEITGLSEYYPTRTEVALLSQNCGDIGKIAGPGRAIVEFGSGSSTKTPILLSCVEPAAYVPIDISGEFMRQSAVSLACAFPELPVMPLEADFTNPIVLPDAVRHMPKLGFFPGSTIGNMVPFAAANLLRAMRETLGGGAMLLIGIDRLKDEETLVRAYDDSEGVTAAFNLNLLRRINRELGGDIPLRAFRHVALWNAWEARIEMHLQAARDLEFMIGGHRFAMAAGETLHTENSYKYSLNGVRLLLRAGAWKPICHWTDLGKKFAVIMAEAEPKGAFP
jgi:L-histidine Nalpha-methyltransferase